MSIQSKFPSTAPSLLLDFANTKQLDNRITFTRSTPAVYYDGVTTALAEQNLFNYSQDFDNANWVKYKTTITANSTTAPDGTTTADSLVENNENFQHLVYRNVLQNVVPSSSIATMSIYAKANSRSWINLNLYDGSNRITWFDLTNGVVGTNASGNTAVITSVGNGWYRCSITRTIANAAVLSPEFGISPSDNTYIYTGNGTSNIYIWGAQLEQRTSVTAYTATTSTPITNYIPVLLTAGGNQPRFDCNPTTGESLGLLIEEQRTNLVTNSGTMSNWSKVQITYSSEGIAPDGTFTAQKVIATNTLPTAYTGVSGANTISIYAKAAGKNWLALINTSGSNFAAWFNIATGTIGTVISGYTATITPVGNGWYRCALTATSGSFSFHQWAMTDADNSQSVTVNSVNGIFVWGAQAEAGLFATSYIATTSASATRTADTPIITGNNLTSWYSNNIGTIYASISVPSSLTVFSNSAATLFSMGSGRVTTRIINTGNAAAVLDQIGGLVSTSNSVTLNAENRTATSFSQGNYSICLNNGTVVSNTSTTVVQPATQLAIGFDAYDNRPNTSIKKIAYYPSVLTNAQLQALTS